MAKSKYALVSIDVTGTWDEIQGAIEVFEDDYPGSWVRVAKVTPAVGGKVTANVDLLLSNETVSGLFLEGSAVNSARGYDFTPYTFKKKAVKEKSNKVVLKNPDGTEVTV